MATQRVIIAKIGGTAGDAVAACFRRWSDARISNDTNAGPARIWPRRARTEMNRLVAAVREHSDRPPVLYCAEHIDMWSMGDSFEQWLSPGGKPGSIHVASDRYDLYQYSLPDGGALEQRLRRGLRLKRLRERNPQEEPWFVTRLLEAVTAWERLAKRSGLLVVRECVAGTASDEAVAASLKSMPPGLHRLTESVLRFPP